MDATHYSGKTAGNHKLPGPPAAESTLLSNPTLRALPARNATKVIEPTFVLGASHTTCTDTHGRDEQGSVSRGLSEGMWKPTWPCSGIPHPLPSRGTGRRYHRLHPTHLSSLHYFHKEISFIPQVGINNLLATHKHDVDPLYKPQSN